MGRKGPAVHREALPDPKYHSRVIAKFVNVLMKRGKKSVAENVMYNALEIVGKKSNEDPVDLFKKALENVKPVLEVRSRRVGGSTYQVPIEVRSERRITLGMRWLVESARNRNEKTMGLRLAGEILDAFESRGAAVKKKEDTHRMADANKAFSHFRW